jgi:hypothetical protein
LVSCRDAAGDLHHHLAAQHAGNAVGNGGTDFAKASCRQFRKQSCGEPPADIGKGIPVEEKKRCAAMTGS